MLKNLVLKRYEEGRGEVARAAKCLLCKPEGLEFSCKSPHLRKQAKETSWAWWQVPLIAVLGREAETEGSVEFAGQPG